MLITPEQIKQFREQGFFILEKAMTDEQLEGLRAECQRYIDKYEAEMEAKGVTTLGINHYKKRYFISNRGAESSIITSFLSILATMAAVCGSVLRARTAVTASVIASSCTCFSSITGTSGPDR